jgi:ABC-type Mn2+/Zn2+ transport system ATPase subunit
MSVDAELKQCLIEMEERIVTSLKAYVNERSELVKAYVNERSEIVETRLLTEFHKWASPAEARNRTISAALRAIDMEMEFISDRVSKLEGKQPQ